VLKIESSKSLADGQIMIFPTTDLVMVMVHSSDSAQIAGEDYTLTCQVTNGGTMTPTYRWFRNGSLLTGQASVTLPFSPLRESDSGVYTCEGTRSSITRLSEEIRIATIGKFISPHNTE
jgi:hypothetical protein